MENEKEDELLYKNTDKIQEKLFESIFLFNFK